MQKARYDCTNELHTPVVKEIEECVALLVHCRSLDEQLALARRISNIRECLSGHEQMPIWEEV
tara:strand:- start:7 stop:195 length:189 start_codon:yes stop_codon:yes gene_type:complete